MGFFNVKKNFFFLRSGYLSPVACTSVHALTKALSSMLESFIFVYLGMALFLTDGQNYNGVFILVVLVTKNPQYTLFFTTRFQLITETSKKSERVGFIIIPGI